MVAPASAIIMSNETRVAAALNDLYRSHFTCEDEEALTGLAQDYFLSMPDTEADDGKYKCNTECMNTRPIISDRNRADFTTRF